MKNETKQKKGLGLFSAEPTPRLLTPGNKTTIVTWRSQQRDNWGTAPVRSVLSNASSGAPTGKRAPTSAPQRSTNAPEKPACVQTEV